MSKVGGALPSWYWPVGVPRRVPVAQQPLGRVFRQKFAVVKDRPAVVSQTARFSYGELLEQSLNLAGGIQAASLDGTLAIADPDPVQSLLLCIAGLFAGRCVFLANPAESPQRLAAQLTEAKASTVVTSDGVSLPDGISVKIVGRSELKGNFNDKATAKRATDPALLIPSGRGVVAHSHFSASAMAASMAAFIFRLREIPFLCTEPSISSWEMLIGILVALSQGRPIAFGRFDEFDSPELVDFAREGYLIISQDQANKMLVEGKAPALISRVGYVFVSTGYFSPRWRRRLESLYDRPIFPLWGLPELGPLVASHPTWLPPHGHGFPLVNVSLIPIDPGSGKVSIVPWEMLDEAEVGVETLAAMLGYVDTTRNVGIKAGTAVRTRQVASMDHVGVVALQETQVTASAN
jgi:hypothetical protein